MIARITHNNQSTTTTIQVTPTDGYRGYNVNKIFSEFKDFADSENASIESEQHIKDQINQLL